MKLKFIKIFKLLILIIIGYGIFSIAVEDGIYWTKSKFYRLLLTNSVEKIRDDYANKSCQKFSQTEKENGNFEAFITGYCRPQVKEYNFRKDFLCAVALNCSCPNSTNKDQTCSSHSLTWSACNEFNEQTIPYCDKTASGLEPKSGHVATDWSCFPQNTTLEINNKIYKVTDKGRIIKGRRIDIWFDDCNEALKATGIYKVKIPK